MIVIETLSESQIFYLFPDLFSCGYIDSKSKLSDVTQKVQAIISCN